MTTVTAYQKHLKTLGHYSGQVDGDFGPLTLSAALDYHCHGKPPAWMLAAAGELGISEIYGKRNNPRIVAYHATTTLGASADEVPWCSSFVNWCMERAGVKGTDSAAARSWDSWGLPSVSQVGCVVTFPRTGGSGRHVAFVAGYHGNTLFHLGGNQSDRVNVGRADESTATAMRWPASQSAPRRTP